MDDFKRYDCEFEVQSIPSGLASVHEDTLILHEVRSERISKHRLPVDFSVGGAYVDLNSNSLLCLAGWPPSTSVYELDLVSIHLRPLHALHTPRCAPGLIKVLNSIYVFGGCDALLTGLRTCEKMDLATNHWTVLSNQLVHPRYSFTCCQHNSQVYLISASTAVVETFTPRTHTFGILAISLPTELEICAGHPSVSFIANKELCLLTAYGQMARLRLGIDRKFRLMETSESCRSSRSPVIRHSQVLICKDDKVMYFSLLTYTFTRMVV